MRVWAKPAEQPRTAVPVCHDLTLASELIGIHDSGAMWWPSQQTLVISDLHLHCQKGSDDTSERLEHLARMIDLFRPTRVICLGDGCAPHEQAPLLSPSYRAMLATLQLGREWYWIWSGQSEKVTSMLPGKHLPELTISRLTFRYAPSDNPEVGEVCGHLCPAARVRKLGRAMRLPCFATDGRRLLLPAFSTRSGGENVLGDIFQSVFNARRFSAFLLGQGRLYPYTASKLISD